MKWRTAHTNTVFEKRKFGQNCHSLSLLVIRCHRLSLVVPAVVIRCHSLSLVVPLVVTRWTTCLSFYKRSISREPEFSQIWDLCRNTVTNTNFHYRTNSVKINDKIVQYFLKKTCFWPIFDPFSQFFGEKNISGKSSSITHNFIWVSSTMPRFRKN